MSLYKQYYGDRMSGLVRTAHWESSRGRAGHWYSEVKDVQERGYHVVQDKNEVMV